MEIKHLDVVLCEFYFSDLNKSKKRPILVFKEAIVKKYGTLSKKSYEKYHNLFCLYFGCDNEQKQ